MIMIIIIIFYTSGCSDRTEPSEVNDRVVCDYDYYYWEIIIWWALEGEGGVGCNSTDFTFQPYDILGYFRWLVFSGNLCVISQKK